MFTLANEQESDVLCSFDLKPEFKIEPLSSSLNASGLESLTPAPNGRNFRLESGLQTNQNDLL